jgi:hypothetical protein
MYTLYFERWAIAKAVQLGCVNAKIYSRDGRQGESFANQYFKQYPYEFSRRPQTVLSKKANLLTRAFLEGSVSAFGLACQTSPPLQVSLRLMVLGSMTVI